MARILIIEDAPADMRLIEIVVKRAGHTALIAATAEIGLPLAKALLPELIIMDIQLPGMDGLTATRRLKDNTQTRYIPVIALTLPIKGAELRICEAGCDGYVIKPLSGEALQAEISMQISRHNIE
jgi:two-component system cell cycle response regulator DivK